MEFGELSENPFSMQKPARRRKRNAFVSAIKFLLLVGVCLGATVAIGSQSRKWLAQHLVADFESLSAEEKQTRLIQVADLGVPGIEPLVEAMADQDETVARTAYELLQSAQEQWTSFDLTEQRRFHHALIDSLEGVAVYLPDDRTGWGTSLVQQAVALSADRRDDDSRMLFRRANQAIDMLSLSERSGPSVLSDEPIDLTEPRRLGVRSRTLTISQTEQPATEIELQSGKAEQVGRIRSEAKIVSTAKEPEVEGPVTAASSIYRSGGTVKLQPTKSREDVLLTKVGQSQETSYQAKAIHSIAHVVDSPVQTLDDQSVMLWLGSPHTQMREKAKAELTSRGYGFREIEIARQIAAGDTPSRMALIDAIARSDNLDPRPWLLMLLNDQNRQVKLKAVAVLATMKDAYVDQRLRKQLGQEVDTAVSDQIRRVLELR